MRNDLGCMVNNQSIQNFVSAVYEALNEIGKDIIILGHSMGGFVTQKFLEKFTCKAAILLASVPPTGILPDALRYLRAHPDTFPDLINQDIYAPFVKYAEDLYSPATNKDKIKNYKTLMRSESFTALINMMFKPIKTVNPNKVPLLVTGADKNRVITINEIKKPAHSMKKNRLYFLVLDITLCSIRIMSLFRVVSLNG